MTSGPYLQAGKPSDEPFLLEVGSIDSQQTSPDMALTV